jgi:hypothetical protein
MKSEEKQQSNYKRIKNFLSFNSDLWAFPLAVIAVPFIQDLIYWYDPSASMISVDYLFDLVIAGLFIMGANFFSLGFLRFVVKPMFDYRRKIVENKKTAFNIDFDESNYKRLLLWLAYYLVPFISFLLVACSFHAVK